MGDPRLNRRSDAHELEPAPAPQKARQRKASNGSQTLRERCELLFDRFAEQHRVTPAEARILILDTGVRL